jgi:hypothetical protein
MPEPHRYADLTSRLSDSFLGPVLDALRVDFVPADPQPSWALWVVATAVSVLGSLAADAVLVAIGTRVFPGTAHFAHFQFSDYAKLTVIGVLIACVGWPIVTRLSSRPRWLFFRVAIAVTVVLFLPDAYILSQGQPPRGVLVLVCMHVAIAVITYNALVRIAPAGEASHRGSRVVSDA